MLAAAHQIGGPGLEGAGVELGGFEQRGAVPRVPRLRDGAVGVLDPQGSELSAHLGVAEPVQAAQYEGGSRGPAERGEPLVQGEFIGAAGAGNTRSPHTCGSTGGSCARLGQARRRNGNPASSACRTTCRRTNPYPGSPRRGAGIAASAPPCFLGSDRCTSACAVSTRRLRPSEGGNTR